MKVNVIKADRLCSYNRKLMCFLLGILEIKFKKIGYSVGKYMNMGVDPDPEHINIFVYKTHFVIFRATTTKQPIVCNYHETEARSVFELHGNLQDPIRSTRMLIETMRSRNGSSVVELAESVKCSN